MRFRGLIGALMLLWLAISPAMAQQSKSLLLSTIATCFPDNVVGAITPAVARNCFNTFVASWQQYSSVNAQTGTSYTVQQSDYGQLVTFNNSGAVAVSVPQAIGSFATFNFYASNLGTGTVTFTPTTSTINGASTYALSQGQAIWIVSDGTNYQVWKGGIGSVAAGTAGQLAWYSATGTAVGGNANANMSSGALTLGQVGSIVGSICFANATSGTVCIQPATGALGTAIATLPAGTYNIVGDSLTQILTNKTFNCANNTCTVRLPTDITGQLPPANGGTGLATLTAHAVILGEGTSNVAFATIGTSGRVLVDQGSGNDPIFTTIGGSSFGTQSANTIFAGPTTGAAANPTFRTTVPADLGSSPASHAVPVDVAGTSTYKVVPDCQDLSGNHINYTQSSDTWSCGNTSSGGGGSATIVEGQGRLTLTANTPVMTATAAAQTTLRYDCYIGSNVPYYNGTSDLLDTISSCEVTDAMVSAASAGQVVVSNVYDVWWVHTGANRICLAMSSSSGGGGGWSSDTGGSNTARGSGYSQLDRVTRAYTTNKNSISNCFNAATNYGPVSANQGTYLGTVYASANGQISYTFGASASGGTAGLFGVWNMYNRVLVTSNVTDSGSSYSISSGTPRQARGSSGNQIQIVLGLNEDGVVADYMAQVITPGTAGAFGRFGVGYDTTTAYTCPQFAQVYAAAGAAFTSSQDAHCTVPSPGFGLHTISANESADGTNSLTFDVNSVNTLSAMLRM